MSRWHEKQTLQFAGLGLSGAALTVPGTDSSFAAIEMKPLDLLHLELCNLKTRKSPNALAPIYGLLYKS